ncbi:MAG: SIS domain-containing protein [Bacteroidetes bacterium]|nr:MAG: SIS domain-containing protein [Bacteroidota bacterium]
MNVSSSIDQAALTDSGRFWERYAQAFVQALEGTEVSDENGRLAYPEALGRVRDWLVQAQHDHKKVMIIGNGGSAAVASHMAIDFWKNGGIRALTFNEGATLTCVSNDYCYEEVFAVPIQHFGDAGDIVMCISSSGGSENILRGARAARAKGARVITLSGFQPDNALRQLGDLNFYVPSHSYGFVETLHQFLIHSMLDIKLFQADHMDVYHRNLPMGEK